MGAILGLIIFTSILRVAVLRFTDRDAAWVRGELAKARIQPANELADGARGTTVGMAVAVGALLRAPSSGRDCIYWQLRFDEVGAGDFVELARVHHGSELMLVTATGTVRVVIDKPQVDLRAYVTELPGHLVVDGNWDHHPVLSHATRAGRRVRLNHPGSLLRITEYVIEPGAAIVVSGWCAREPDPTATEDVVGYREQLPTRPVLSGSRRARLLIGTAPPHLVSGRASSPSP